MSDDAHICDRSECPPKCVSGPKLNCAKCQKTCFLYCFGFEKCGDSGVKINLSSNCSIAVDPNSISFTCSLCDSSFLTDDINEKLSNNVATKQTNAVFETPKTSKDTQSSTFDVKVILNKVTSMLHTVIKTTDSTAADICEIKAITTDTNASVKSFNGTNAKKVKPIVQCDNATNVNKPKPESFADILKQQQNMNIRTPSSKRKIGANNLQSIKPTNSKPNKLPTPKEGKRTGVTGLAAAPPAKPKPKYNKQIHVSRIATSTTVEAMNVFIESNSSLKANQDFRCTSLVKKGKDIETYSFISFKIALIEEVCGQLLEPEFWPEGVLVRPFIPPPPTFSDFLTASPGTSDAPPSKFMKTNGVKNDQNKVDSENTVPIIDLVNQK